MNPGQFKYPLCYMCLLGSVVTPWSLLQEIVGLFYLLIFDTAFGKSRKRQKTSNVAITVIVVNNNLITFFPDKYHHNTIAISYNM